MPGLLAVHTLFVGLLVLARAHEHARDAVGLGAEHVGFQVVADHQRLVGGHAHRVQGGGEERLGGLADHRRLHVRGLFQTEEQRTGVEFEAVGRAPVEVAVHRDEGGTALEVREHAVEGLVAELGARAAEHDDLRLVVRPDEGDPVEVVGARPVVPLATPFDITKLLA